MITLTTEYKDVKKANVYELIAVAEGGNPFVKDKSGTFLNIASPADMVLLPDTPGESLYRDSTISVIFRDVDSREFTEQNMEEQIAELNSIALTDLNGGVLYSNIP